MASKRYLGLDYGEKRIGVAISDEFGHVRRLTVLESGETATSKIAELLKTYHAEAVVVGRPRTIEGELGHQASITTEFGKELELKGLTVLFEDETTTTELAYERLRLEGIKDPKIAKKLVDMVAAEIILEGYLNK